MNFDEPRIDRIDELLADLALQGLSDPELAELARIAEDIDAQRLPLELAAAEAELALAKSPLEPMPTSLQERLEADAESFLTRGSTRSSFRAIGTRVLPWLGWVAAAASLLYAVHVERTRTTIPDPPRNPSLLERLANVPPRPFLNTDHPLARGGGGSLVWSGDRQEGYLAIKGLAEVDPAKGVYQLWIFDGTRDERFPIDGGTFVVNDARSTTLVPIKPALAVRRPTLFAITLEPPGGVVVSDRKRILLTASP